MSSRKYRSLCRSGQHSGPVRSGRKAFFSACAASREKRRQKGSVMPRGEPASGGLTAGGRAAGCFASLSRLRCGKDAENRFDFSVLRRTMPHGRQKRRCTAGALQDNCVIFHTKIVSTDAPSHLPFCHDARYSQVSFGAGPE